MKVWAQWYGGPSYRMPDYDEYEEFDSIKQAKFVFWCRDSDSRFPCVSMEEAEMFIFLTDPMESQDRYPDFSFRFGPRGGVIRCNC